MKTSDIRALLRRAHRDPDGSYRVIASKALDGRPVGGFRFYGVRSDDPNDLIPHEHRRELRAYGTFSAWLNHVDSKSINTLDTVIDQGERKVIRHHLLDFGSTIGSAGVYPREPFEGSEYLVEGKKTLAGMPTFGFYIKTWRTMPMYRARAVGAFPIDHSNWDPEKWKPRYSNSAFRSARFDDKFWAARRLQSFSDEMLKAVPRVGQFDDAKSEEMLAKFLIDRRDAIVRRYLPAVNPIVDVQLAAAGPLTFRNCGRRCQSRCSATADRRHVVAVRQRDRCDDSDWHDDCARNEPQRTAALEYAVHAWDVYPRRDCVEGRTGELGRTITRVFPARSAVGGSSSDSSGCLAATHRVQAG